jgi:hypothetical protein
MAAISITGGLVRPLNGAIIRLTKTTYTWQ